MNRAAAPAARQPSARLPRRAFWRVADYSLRAKLLIAFLAVSLIPLAVLAVVNLRSSQQALTDAANETLLGVASQTALSLDSFFDNTRGVVQTESQLPAIRDYLSLPADARDGSETEAELRSILRTWWLRDTRARSYLLLDANGFVLLSTSSLDVGRDHSQSDFYRQTMSTGQSYVSDVLFEPRAQEGDIYFSMVVRDSDLSTLGVLVARYTARAIQDILVETNGLAGADSFGQVFDENLLHLAHGTAPEVNFKLVAPVAPDELVRLQAASRVPQIVNFEPATNQPELARQLMSMSTLPYFTATDAATGDRLSQVAVTKLTTKPWIVAFFQPRDVFLAPVQDQTRTTLTLSLLMAVGVAALALLGAQVLANPLARLTATAEQVAGGDLSVRAQVGSADEIGILAQTFNTMTGRLNETVMNLESRVAERTGQLQAAADIGRAIASVRNLDELLPQALELIRERFGFYHASIFLVDEANRTAVLRESTGPVGAQLKARGHKLAIGSQSLIGWVTANRQPRAALDVADDPFHFKNPLLPDTRSELAIPLIIGDRLLGALDVQSKEPNAFGPGDIQVLRTLADQLSVAIENASLFQRTQASLAELSTLYQRLTGASWRSLLGGRAHETVYQARTQSAGETLVTGSPPLQVPLQLRDRAVGVIEMHGRPASQWTDEERAALGTVAAQISAALESAALLEEAQRRRLREQLINEVTYQMRGTLNPTSVLHSGMRELGRALGATEVVVRLSGGAPAAAAQPANGEDQA
jgi:GAF domain-containing protein/HAMP domain-containing protein